MFRALIFPVFRSTRLCVTACGIMHPRCCRPVAGNVVRALYHKAVTHSLYQWCTVKQISDNEIYLLIKYIKNVLWGVAKLLSYTEDVRCLKVKQVRNSERDINSLRIKIFAIFFILYYDLQMHNYFINYHTHTCFDTIISSSGNLWSILC